MDPGTQPLGREQHTAPRCPFPPVGSRLGKHGAGGSSVCSSAAPSCLCPQETSQLLSACWPERCSDSDQFLTSISAAVQGRRRGAEHHGDAWEKGWGHLGRRDGSSSAGGGDGSLQEREKPVVWLIPVSKCPVCSIGSRALVPPCKFPCWPIPQQFVHLGTEGRGRTLHQPPPTRVFTAGKASKSILHPKP